MTRQATDELTFADFRRMATDDSLSQYEKIGFPDSYRDGLEERIFEDILAKLPALTARGSRVLDIGPGCSGLPRLLLELAGARGHQVTFVDSLEMLDHHPDLPFLTKVPGSFPDTAALPADARRGIDAILVYSVLHYVYAEGDVEHFLDRAIDLLAHGGTLLIGDVPNLSKRRRFFSSPAGIDFHKRFMNTDEPPEVGEGPEPGKIDDAVVLRVAQRARAAGCDAYVVPQRADLPMANRREDILVIRP
jgi:SAM-dependent methyltransferase